MSLENMDKAYVECCKTYLKGWIKKYNVEKLQISDEAFDEMILSGGEGLRALQETFVKIIHRAEEEGVETIDIEFIKQCH